jgi:hypothetical protein
VNANVFLRLGDFIGYGERWNIKIGRIVVDSWEFDEQFNGLIACDHIHCLFEDKFVDDQWTVNESRRWQLWELQQPSSIVFENMRDVDLLNSLPTEKREKDKLKRIHFKNCLIPGQKWLNRTKKNSTKIASG